MNSKFHRLRAVSLDELRVRGSQAVNAFVEQKGWSRSSRLVSDKAFLKLFDQNQFGLRSSTELLKHFRSRTRPAFFASFDNPQSTVAAFRAHWLGAEAETIRRADRVCEGVFDLLAYRGLNFGTPIDWHLEPLAGKHAPLIHWSKLNYLDADQFG